MGRHTKTRSGSHCVAFALACALAPSTLLAQAGEWTVDAVPVVSIGELDGPEEYQLFNPLQAFVLSDGTIVVQDNLRGQFDVRYFGPDGRHMATVGGWGQGPYEFQGVLTAVMPALTSVGIDPPHVAVSKTVGSGMPSPGVQRFSEAVLMLDLTTGAATAVAELEGPAAFYERVGPGWTWYRTPFGPQARVVGGGGLLWIGDSSSRDIRGYRPGTRDPVVVVKSGFEPADVSREDRARMREAYASRDSGERRKRWARYAASMEFPERMPFYGQLKSDRSGNLWVQEYDPPWEEGPQRWKVYSPEGEELADVVVPEAAVPSCSRQVVGDCRAYGSPLDVGPDYMLLRQDDDMGVARIVRFEIRHGGSRQRPDR